MIATDATSGWPSQEAFADRCLDDPELGLAIRHWTGGLRFECDAGAVGFSVHNGAISAELPADGDGVIVVTGQIELALADYGISAPSAPIVASVEDTTVLELQVFLTQ